MTNTRHSCSGDKEPTMPWFCESTINLCESNKHLKDSASHQFTTQTGSGVHIDLMLQRIPLPNHKAVQLPAKLRKNNFPASWTSKFYFCSSTLNIFSCPKTTWTPFFLLCNYLQYYLLNFGFELQRSVSAFMLYQLPDLEIRVVTAQFKYRFLYLLRQHCRSRLRRISHGQAGV